MNMELGLYQEQTQRLVMTMQMKQAIQMLQFTMEELDTYLQQQFNENPLLQYRPASVLQETSYPGSGYKVRQNHSGNSGTLSFEQYARSQETMQTYLSNQVSIQDKPRHILRAAQTLVGCLDESGYLRGSDEELQSLCKCDKETLEGAIGVLQQCDPVGIGTRSLTQCLLLQAERLPNPLQYHATLVISHYLSDVATSRLHHIGKELNLTLTEVQEAVDAIRIMNPRPGMSLGDNNAQYIVPEVFVRKEGDFFRVFTNADAEPEVHIDKTYQALLAQQSDPAAKRFLQQKLQGVYWLRKALVQRQITLARVATAIVDVQQRFFTQGPSGLQPLTLKQVADTVDLHESTVSRTVRGKYMETPVGVFELKYFFTSELQTSSGNHSVSAHSVKHLIRTLVGREDALHPLSDEALSKQLLEHGIRVSRRTVAKYRDEMRIPASSKRRRFA
ncbi:RNA polymerase factor sigma-54 [Alicyclobacillus sp. SO9]|uniref:RNA polymerase factor sigma-54 n=1 Tax=Alicyclobacillus sp. SO9 TaxID=2665646 RepID=UPI0018E8104A|nr:RNA polymerase factor sigma-54 [Alicyclobacillus sp. SO9]QQE79981.1 RNA polymerase factor sigma-54 [Alicyclobacillus sp. SO9]